MKTGDFVRYTKFADMDCAKAPVWAIISEYYAQDRFRVDFVCGGEGTDMCELVQVEPLKWGGGRSPSYEYTIPDEVPEEVLAEHTRRVLLGQLPI